MKFQANEKLNIHISAKENETHWVFSVKDNGIGFDEKYADKIFVIFQRLHNNQEYAGTGIGLSICKKIVEKHEGAIWVKSKPGTGSEFFFSIKK